MIRAIPHRLYPERAGGGRWISVAALCLCIALSMHAHRNDGAGIEEPAGPEKEASVQTSPAQPDYFSVVKDASMRHDLDPKLIASMIQRIKSDANAALQTSSSATSPRTKTSMSRNSASVLPVSPSSLPPPPLSFSLNLSTALRSCLETIHLGQTFQHEAGHGDVNPCLIGPGQALVAFAEPTCVVEPGEGSLDHPAAW